jgi:hypothetical protein
MLLNILSQPVTAKQDREENAQCVAALSLQGLFRLNCSKRTNLLQEPDTIHSVLCCGTRHAARKPRFKHLSGCNRTTATAIGTQPSHDNTR